MLYIPVITVQHGSADTVVRAMNAFNGKCRFRGMPAPWPIFKKNGTVDYVGDPIPHARIGVKRFKGGVSAHARNCHPQASIFSFFLITCASLQVSLLNRSPPLTTQTTQPVGVHIPYMVSIIKINIFPFLPKNVTIANSKGYNLVTVKDRRELYSPNRGFSGSRNRTVSFKFTPDWPLLPWQPTVVISTQNWP